MMRRSKVKKMITGANQTKKKKDKNKKVMTITMTTMIKKISSSDRRQQA